MDLKGQVDKIYWQSI